MNHIHIDDRFDVLAHDGSPVYPLVYTHELEAGMVCRADGSLAFVEFKQGFATATLWVRCTQDEASDEIEHANIFWGAESDAQELTGALAVAAEAFVKLHAGDIAAAFHEHAKTDWRRILGKGYARMRETMEAA
jgi:hypothetical protein